MANKLNFAKLALVALAAVDVLAFSPPSHGVSRGPRTAKSVTTRGANKGGKSPLGEFNKDDGVFEFSYEDEDSEANRQQAALNRIRRISDSVKKRRRMIDVNQAIMVRDREAERVKMRGAARIYRWPKDDEMLLKNLEVGQWIDGQVTRLVSHGAWVDVASQIDGFLHISEIKDGFVHHPADELEPGQELRLQVKHVDNGEKILSLTLVGLEEASPHDGKARVEIDELEDDEELWAVVRRVTSFGAFVDVGTTKDAFLHLNDFPDRLVGEQAPDVFKRGQRLRVYVREVDLEQNRLKVTAFRPKTLPKVE